MSNSEQKENKENTIVLHKLPPLTTKKPIQTLPINSPVIDSVEVVKKGKVRRAKLNYIRNEKKTPKIKERN